MQRFFRNSLYISSTVTFGQVSVTAVAGYGVARLNLLFRKVLFALLLRSLMVPPRTTIIPLFPFMRTVEPVDCHWAIIFPGITGTFAPGISGVFGVFMMRQFFPTLPKDLTQAAKTDGAGQLRNFRSVAAPLAKPQMASPGVIILTFTRKDYFLPLIFTNATDRMVLPVGIMSNRERAANTAGRTDVIAAVSLSILPVPVAFLPAQRRIVDSFVRAVVK